MLKSQRLRNAEYHDMTEIFDSLYKDSKNGKIFYKLIDIIGSEDNIILAYRNIKKNDGSKTPGVDHISIEDLGNLSTDKIVKIIRSKLNDYKPKPVKYNRLRAFKITKNGDLNPKGVIYKNFRKSKQLRFLNDRPLVPIAYIKTKPPINKNQDETPYTEYGRSLIHEDLGIDLNVLRQLMKSEMYSNSIEYYDNRISLYCAQIGKCGITGIKLDVENIHCHHKLPKCKGGSDKYENLIIVHADIHRLIHATELETINKYVKLIKDDKQLKKLNNLRRLVGLENIEITL